MKELKVHAIIPGKLYQRGEFAKFPLPEKLRELARLRVSVVVNLWSVPDIELQKTIPHYYHLPIPDGNIKDGELLLLKGQEIARLIRGGKGAIVHCHAGRNRSGLFNALLCMELLGMSGQEAIDHVRRRRPNAIENNHFVEFLLKQEGAIK